LTAAIATRRLRIVVGDGKHEVEVRLYAPAQKSPGWTCRFEIGWPDGVVALDAEGVDAVQAVELALKAIGAEVYASPYHRDGTLIWERPGGGYGFPVARNLRDLLGGDDKTFDG
jgi:hypothetical protein